LSRPFAALRALRVPEVAASPLRSTTAGTNSALAAAGAPAVTTRRPTLSGRTNARRPSTPPDLESRASLHGDEAHPALTELRHAVDVRGERDDRATLPQRLRGPATHHLAGTSRASEGTQSRLWSRSPLSSLCPSAEDGRIAPGRQRIHPRPRLGTKGASIPRSQAIADRSPASRAAPPGGAPSACPYRRRGAVSSGSRPLPGEVAKHSALRAPAASRNVRSRPMSDSRPPSGTRARGPAADPDRARAARHGRPPSRLDGPTWAARHRRRGRVETFRKRPGRLVPRAACSAVLHPDLTPVRRLPAREKVGEWQPFPVSNWPD
jgi:hypothetical protein